MESEHIFHIGSAEHCKELSDKSVHLVVTSPPYPMIDMWEDSFKVQGIDVNSSNPDSIDYTFNAMHDILDSAWKEMYRVLCPGGFLCVNIGDATRTLDGTFRLFSNHSRILQKCIQLGFHNLPNIIWRKQTNAPNKFMGSGMLPAGAYVTLEHEYILIFRKPGKRLFKSEQEKLLRKESAFFWEERNVWFSDVWDFKGTTQALNKSANRERSGAFPIELPHRLINMYSLRGDTVLDPFLGTGTTTLSAMINGRNSVGYEIDESFIEVIDNRMKGSFTTEGNSYTYGRLSNHQRFVEEYKLKGRELKHTNVHYHFPVMTNQETNLRLFGMKEIVRVGTNQYRVSYTDPDINQQSLIF